MSRNWKKPRINFLLYWTSGLELGNRKVPTIKREHVPGKTAPVNGWPILVQEEQNMGHPKNPAKSGGVLTGTTAGIAARAIVLFPKFVHG